MKRNFTLIFQQNKPLNLTSLDLEDKPQQSTIESLNIRQGHKINHYVHIFLVDWKKQPH